MHPSSPWGRPASAPRPLPRPLPLDRPLNSLPALNGSPDMVDDLFLLSLRALGYAPRLLITSDARALAMLLDVAMVGRRGGWAGGGWLYGIAGIATARIRYASSAVPASWHVPQASPISRPLGPTEHTVRYARSCACRAAVPCCHPRCQHRQQQHTRREFSCDHMVKHRHFMNLAANAPPPRAAPASPAPSRRNNRSAASSSTGRPTAPSSASSRG